MIAVCCEIERLAKLKMARRRDVASGSIAKFVAIRRVCQVSNASGCSRSYVVLWKCFTPILWLWAILWLLWRAATMTS
jgi:hypothetical protein